MDLRDMIVNFLGDSITEGAGVEDKERNRFDNVIARKCGCRRVNNYGIGGSRIAHRFHPSEKARFDLDFCGRCWDMDKSADVIVVFGGVNDYFHGDAPMGKPGDTSRDTFCGSVDYLCRTIRELYPDAVPVFFAPAHCFSDAGYSESRHRYIGREEHLLSEYSRNILEIAPRHGFHVFDMAKELGIDPKKSDEREKYTTDGIHFNDIAHHMIADAMIRCISSI